jgi:hypothetical protein
MWQVSTTAAEDAIQGNKGKQPLQQSTAMMQANLKFVMGQPMLTADELVEEGQPCIDLHNY